MLALEPRILQRFDSVQSAARLEHQRIGRVVVGVGGLHQVVADRHADDHVAAQRIQRVAHEADHLRDSRCSWQARRVCARTARPACSRTPRPPRRRMAGCADRRRPGTSWGRPVRRMRRDREPGRAARPAISSSKHGAAAAIPRCDRHARSDQPMHSSSALVNASGFGACFSRTAPPDGIVGARAQIDVDRIDEAHDVLVLAVGRHDQVLRGRHVLLAARHDRIEVGVARGASSNSISAGA